MNLTVERAIRLACSEEVAALNPSLAQSFEECARIQREARSRSKAQGGGCRSGCGQNRAGLTKVGESILRFLSTASDDQVAAIKARLGTQRVRFSVDGVVFER